MNPIGQWKVSALLSAADGEMKWVTREEAEKIEDFDLSMFDAITEFRPDGTVCDLIRIPQGTPQAEIDKAVAEGCEVAGDCIVAGKHAWKEEDGKILYNTNITGEIFDEELSPWAEIEADADGDITLMGLLRLTRT